MLVHNNTKCAAKVVKKMHICKKNVEFTINHIKIIPIACCLRCVFLKKKHQDSILTLSLCIASITS